MGCSLQLGGIMASGDLINYANYKAMAGSSWFTSIGVGGGAGTTTYMIAGSTWAVDFRIWGSGLWGYQSGSLYVYPFDESTGKFSETAVYGSWQSGKGASYGYAWQFYHNYNGGTSGDIHDCQLWKLVVTEGNNDGGSTGTLYVGGLGVLSESIYNSYFKGRKVYCARGDYWRLGSQYTYASEEAFLAAQGYSCLRGTLVSVSTGTYKFICSKRS